MAVGSWGGLRWYLPEWGAFWQKIRSFWLKTASEVEEMVVYLGGLFIQGIDHITLSSCYGAEHFILPGRWIISLPETFWRSGAKAILGFLWAVDDSFAVPFMQRFYEYAKIHPRNIALQKTQLNALELRIGWSPCASPGSPSRLTSKRCEI